MKLFKVGDKGIGRHGVCTRAETRVVGLMIFFIVNLANANPQTEPSDPEAIQQPAPASVEAGKKEEGEYVIEKRPDGTTIKYKKRTTYDFEGSNIEGLYNKPSGSYISNIKDVKGRSIIRIRENFDSEVMDSARAIR